MQHYDYSDTMSDEKFSVLQTGDCPDDEELCVATIADRDSVMGIEPDAYAGFDYLPYTYERFVGGPATTGFVYKKHGEVVGFFSIVLVDGGQTLATSAGRIHPKWRGGGMYGRFKRRVFQRCLDHNPKLRYTVMGTHNLNWDVNGKKLQKVYKVITERDIVVYTVDTADARTGPLRKPAEIPGIKQMSRDDLHSVLKAFPEHLFPLGRIMLDTKSYRIMEENTDLIFSDGNDRIFIASYSDTGVTDLKVSSAGLDSPADETFKSVNPIVLSCGGYYECRQGLTYQVDVFGSGSEDIMRAHIEWHLLRLVDIAGGKPGFLNPTADTDLSSVVDSLKDVYPISKMELPYKRGLLLEMQLRP